MNKQTGKKGTIGTGGRIHRKSLEREQQRMYKIMTERLGSSEVVRHVIRKKWKYLRKS
jgi:hypothetical protein